MRLFTAILLLCIALTCSAQTKVKQYIRVWMPIENNMHPMHGADDYSKKQLEPIMNGQKTLKFNSWVESVNYLVQHGWELTTIDKNENFNVFVREVELTEDIKVTPKD